MIFSPPTTIHAAADPQAPQLVPLDAQGAPSIHGFIVDGWESTNPKARKRQLAPPQVAPSIRSLIVDGWESTNLKARKRQLAPPQVVWPTAGGCPRLDAPCSIQNVPGLDTPIMYVRGVGPRLAEMLVAKGIQTAEDLLYHLPFRYEDRQHPRSLDELKPGETASVIAEVRGSLLLRTRKAPLFELTVGQGRCALKCIWFNGSYLNGKFHAGQTIAVYGKIEPSRSSSNFKMIQPQFELLPDDADDAETRLLEVGRITPVYESLGGSRLASRWQRKVIFHLLEGMRGSVPECLPREMLSRLGLPDRETALREVHYPPEGTSLAQLQASATPPHRRLIFEELFFLELGLELKRRRMRERAGIAFSTGDNVREAIREVLPFHPTAAQKRALGEIVADMRQPSPMRRLLQGDVGSGKTIVALQAMLVAMENGYQAALMAPTEILATQHFLAARKLLERSSRKPRIVLLTGSLDNDRKRHTRGLINRGEAQLGHRHPRAH